MAHLIHNCSLAALILLLVAAAIGDARRFIIPNELCLALAVLALPWWLTAGVPFWMLGAQAAFALLVFGVFAGVFALGVMGGGDVKLFAALALWLPWQPFLRMMMLVGVLGGVLTLALLGLHRLRRREGAPEIPYGVAISAGALVILGQGIVNPLAG